MLVYKKGSKGNQIRDIQEKLKVLGFYKGVIDGDFGMGSDRAVRSFQKAVGLKADGIVGEKTWDALFDELKSDSDGNTIHKIGSTGDEVRKIQERLQLEGLYKGTIDGEFGRVTLSAIKAFQKAIGYIIDGFVGSGTWKALFDEETTIIVPKVKEGNIEIDKSLRLTSNHYFKGIHQKNLITIHHTVGGSAKSTFRWWQIDRIKVGTAYIIDRDGTIFEVFSPKYWAGHHGARGDRNRLDKRSVGIELSNFGPLQKKENQCYVFGKPFKGKVYDNKSVWRHSQYYEQYPEEQIQSLTQLINYLLDQFPTIPRDTPSNRNTNYTRFKNYKGIIGHTFVREDKSDPHLGLNWETLVQKCNLRLD